MALWQYDFELRLKERLEIKVILKEIKDIFWEIFEKDEFHIDFWSYEKDRCTLYIKNWLAYSIECRLDLRNLSKVKLEKLFKFIKKYNLKILIIEEKIVWKEEFLERINNSSAKKFLLEWENFFTN